MLVKLGVVKYFGNPKALKVGLYQHSENNCGKSKVWEGNEICSQENAKEAHPASSGQCEGSNRHLEQCKGSSVIFWG